MDWRPDSACRSSAGLLLATSAIYGGLSVQVGKGKLIHAACPVAAPPHYLPLVVPLRPGPLLCVLLAPALPRLAILFSNALTFSRTCPSLRLLVLPWPSLLPFSPCLRFLSLFAVLPLPLLSLLPLLLLLLLPEVVTPLSLLLSVAD